MEYRYIHGRNHFSYYGEGGTSKKCQRNIEVWLLTLKKTNPPSKNFIQEHVLAFKSHPSFDIFAISKLKLK